MNGPTRILIVDDSREDCAVYRRFLEGTGDSAYTCAVTHSAAAGLQHCRLERPDCILLDFSLPDADGLDFLAQLRGEYGENGPPVVMVTGQGNEAIAVQAMKLGAQDYLIKGLSRDGLRHSLTSAMEYMALRRQVEAHQSDVARLSAERAQLVEELKRHAEELAAADRRKNEFLAVLAHELRNPLGPIRNAAFLLTLGETPLSPDEEEARAVIDRQVGHMARLIDDLLDVSRIVRGKVLLRKESVELTALVRSAVEDHRSEFRNGGLNLTVSMPADKVWVHGDPTRLSQIVGNILDNARKFTSPGGNVEVSITVTEGGKSVVIRVADSGEGMDGETLLRMFDVFSQADRSLDRSRGGLGLGLAIVKGLAELHDGGVVATSQGPGRGCEIAVTLPASVAPVDLPTQPADGQSVTPLRILIIEDNKDAAHSLALILRRIGHQVAITYTGLEGLKTAREDRPQLILCDIGLSGGMNGYEFARHLRSDATMASVRLVAVTGYGGEEDKCRARDAGFDLHLTKPIQLNALQAIAASVDGSATI